MLKLITGRAGSGKSEAVMREIERAARAGKQTLLIVPEQASFSFERELTLRLGDALAGSCEIKSFRSLCADVFNECGGGAKRRLDDETRSVLVRRAVTSLADEIVCYRRHKKDARFFPSVSSLINELKNGGATPELLAAAADDAESPLAREKMRELSLIYARYEALIKDRCADPADELSAAAKLCPAAKGFDKKTVFLDGFSGFTEPQLEIILALLARCEAVWCSVCCDDVFSNEDDCFTRVRRNARRLVALARERGTEAAVAIHLAGAPRYKTAGTAFAERWFSGTAVEGGSKGLFEIEGRDPFDEAERVADEICFLVRERGYDYSDIAVTARDVDRYRDAVRRTFALYGIPVFCDENRSLASTGTAAFIAGALAMSSGITTEGLTRLLKTGLLPVTAEQADALDSYAFVWDVDGGAWYSPFTRNPGGLDAPEDAPLLAEIESARQRVVDCAARYIDNAKNKKGGALLRAVYAFMEDCGALKKLAALGDDARRTASLGLAALDNLWSITKEDELSAAELYDLMLMMTAATPVGDIPPSLQQVAFGGADRMMTDNPRAVFVLGLNDGVFPKTSFDSPLLSFRERELLTRKGAELSRDFDNVAEMEEFWLYRALTSSRERLYLCHAASDQRGAALSVCAEAAEFIKASSPQRPESLTAAPGVVNERTAARAYALALERGDSPFLKTVELSPFKDAARRVREAANAPKYSAGAGTMKKLLGDETALSASKIETFEKCRFEYFLRYIIGLKPVAKAEMSPVEAGTFVHGVAERTLKSLNAPLKETGEEELRETALRCADEFVRERLGGLVDSKPRIAYLVERLKEQSCRLLLQLRLEQQTSRFSPRDLELVIARAGDVKPVKLTTAAGESVYVEGKADRVDVYEKDGESYIRVIDYKTGTKSFSLSDVYQGLNMQMLLYLFTICENGRDRYGETVPAGVMYMPADPTVPSASETDAERTANRAYRMDGLVLEDAEIVDAMESGGAGRFIPVELKGELLKSSGNLAGLEKLGRIRRHIDKTVVDMAEALYGGEIAAKPAVWPDDSSSCDYCDYSAVCRRDRNAETRRIEKLRESELFTGEDEA